MKKAIKVTGILVMTGVAAMFAFRVNGKAYIDPSVSSYIIQAVAGIIVAIGAVVGIYYRKAKKKINKKLGIDENRNKEVETDDIVMKNDNEE